MSSYDVDLSQSQRDTLDAVTIASASFSFCGSIFIVLCYLRFQRLRRQSHQIFWMSVSDILASIGYFIGSRAKEDRALCQFQGFWIQFFSLASVLWTACLAYHIFARVKKHQTDTTRLELFFHVFVWLFSLLCAALPFATDNYGPAGSICWIYSTDDVEADPGTFWRYFVFYLWVWLAMLFNGYVYVSIIRYVRMVYSIQGFSPSDGNKELSVINRLRIYPLILLIVWLFPTINRLHNSANPTHPSYALHILAALFEPMQGFLNSIAYGLTKNVQREVKKAFCGGENDGAQLEEDATAASTANA